jgi:hypothetical protein
MTKLMNCSIMEPPSRARGSLRCTAVGQPPRAHPPPPAWASRSQLHPPLGITSRRMQGGAHLDRRDPSRSRLGSASLDPGEERNGGEQRPGPRERWRRPCGEDVPGRRRGAERGGDHAGASATQGEGGMEHLGFWGAARTVLQFAEN